MGASANSTMKAYSDVQMDVPSCIPTWSIGPADPFCCISYNLQPHTTDNRHVHAYLSMNSRLAFLHIADITHGKTLKVSIIDDREVNVLSRRSFLDDSLKTCNVVCVHKDLVVVQIFCTNAIRFVVCSFREDTNRIVFHRKYHVGNKLQLYECIFSPDEHFMLIKQNQIYSVMYATGSDVENISLVQCNWENGTCKELPCPNLDERLITSFHNCAIVFDPRTNNDLVVFTCPEIDRGEISLYKSRKDNFLFSITVFKEDFPALPGKCHNLQFLGDGSSVILSVIGHDFHRKNSPIIGRVGVTIVTSYWFDPDCFDKIGSFWYVCPTAHVQYMPMISKSGRFACCGGRLYSVVDMCPSTQGAKSLKRTCQDVIVDCVLAEDVNKLPLPKPLLKYLTM